MVKLQLQGKAALPAEAFHQSPCLDEESGEEPRDLIISLEKIIP
jgi:hypothetical protein